ncbi:MAG: hypothetical protein J6A62_01135 [Oscillospiraceae bacterium]|nr:hypothetical protein [Oscillospiraceae bacterium]
MKRLFFVLGLLFAALGIGWAGYVLYTGGQANPGGAIIAVVWSLVFFQAYRFNKEKD